MGFSSSAAYEYDPSSNAWNSKTPAPFGFGYSVASLNNRLYALATAGSGYNPFAEYDPSTDIWITRQGLAPTRDVAGLVALDDRLFSVGGRSLQAEAWVDVFDPKTGGWDAGTPLLMTRFSAGVAAVGGKVYAFGGAGDLPGPGSGLPLSSVEAGDLGRKRDFYTIPPCRLVDTRTVPFGPLAGPALAAGESRTFPLAGACGIPVSASAVSLNVTVTEATDIGDLRLYPAGSSLPLVSAINWSLGQTRANSAVALLGSAGLSVKCDQASGSVQLVIDVNGYFQ